MRARLTSATIAVAVALASGCGGGGGGGDRLSQDEFREQANAICQKYDERIQATGNPSSPEEVGDFVDEVVPLLQQGIAELRALRPPADAEADYDRMLDETEKAIPAARQLGEAAANNDPGALQEALRAGQQADNASDEIATKLGLTGCASSD